MSCCSEYAKGLIATTGCPSGEIQTLAALGSYDEGPRRRRRSSRTSSARTTSSSSSWTTASTIETRVRDGLLRLGKDLGLPAIATNDSHYTAPRRRTRPTTRCCACSPAARCPTPKRFKFDGDGYYIKSAEEMRSLWEDKHDLKEACDNTLLIAERCEVEFAESNGGYMARADVPGRPHRGVLVRRGGLARHRARATAPTCPTRSGRAPRWSCEVIRDKGYCGYYLVVADFINWAKDNGIRVGPGRGSGAGSIAAYALRITDLCPLQHGLIFERFLNPERPSMPDFDIDFDERRRGEVIQYVSEKYGSDRVAHDRHVRAAQVQGRHQGRQPGARLPVRHGGAHHQGAAGRRHGQGRVAQGAVRPRAQALRRRQGLPRAARERRRGPQDLRHRRRPRGPDPPVGRPRRRRHHEQRAAASTSCRS